MDAKDVAATLKRNEAALRARGVVHAALFGSRARGDNRPDSGIGIMIEIAPDAAVDFDTGKRPQAWKKTLKM
jgi:uncharacterized protein